jgi:pyridinium-3,5-bisthiocarboxylic acid mononucleotide nickel chelatase
VRKIAYIDCFSGISGDMTLGAFVDLGVPIAYLVEKLRGMPLTGFSITGSKVKRHGISATDILVQADDKGVSRDYAAISAMITQSPLPERVKKISHQIFEKLAIAEAAIHDCPIEKVHFHEVGGIDAIVDIVGTALCVEYLGIQNLIGAPVPLGRGFVRSQHGILPVPAPATLELLKHIPVCGSEISQELVTPTGAAILASLCSGFQELPVMVVEKIGYGAGKRELESRPNLLRIVMGKESAFPNMRQQDDVVTIETCIDDMNSEIFGYVMERLFADGALDVFWTPIYMKKNRPGTLVTVLCPGTLKEKLIHRLLNETTSAGVRSYPVQRHTLHREQVSVETQLGPVIVKRIIGPDGNIRLAPEFEACKRIALEKDMPLREVYDRVLRCCTKA